MDANDDSRQLGVYSYAHYRPATNLTLTVGVAIDDIDGTLVSKDAVSPKLGLMWRPTPRTTIRAAAFEALFGSLTTSMQNTQPRLEPVQLAGFTQLLFGGAADSAAVRGLSLEHELSSRLFVGWQADAREIDRLVVTAFGPGPSAVSEVRLSERAQAAYFYWAPYDLLSISARYEHGRYRSALEVFGYAQMNTERLPLEIRYFGRNGLTAGARVSYVKQHGLFAAPSLVPFEPLTVAPGADRFRILDAFIGYRLPNRRGLLSLNADNLLDRQFQFQDIDPTNPSLIPERLVSFRFTLAFD